MNTLRPAYAALRAYDVDPPTGLVSLAENTSPFGLPPSALETLRSSVGMQLSAYPSTYSSELREVYAHYLGVAPEEVIVGVGSDEVMSCAFRALCEPGSRVVHADPTFIMAPTFATSNSLHAIGVPIAEDFDIDVEAMLGANASVTYLCSPNNPTGVSIAPERLALMLQRAQGLVFLDEAYAEFAGENHAAAAPSMERVVVFRTLSKAFGMAGLRVGFAVGHRKLIRELEKARGPYTVNALSAAAAAAAVRQDVAWMRRSVALVIEYRERFVVALHRLGYTPLPSAANFVLIPVPDARATMRALRDRGILVRHFPALARVGDAIRVSIGTWEHMEGVLHALSAADGSEQAV